MTDEQAPAPTPAEQSPIDQPTMTPEAASVEADRLMGDARFSEQWQNKGPGHDFAVQRVKELNRIAHSQSDAPTGGAPVVDESVQSSDNPEQTIFTESDYINAGLSIRDRVGMTDEQIVSLTTTLNEVAVTTQIEPHEMKILTEQIEGSISAEARKGHDFNPEATANGALENLRKAWGDNFDVNLAAFHGALAGTGERRAFIGDAILRSGPATAAWVIKRLISRKGRNAPR